MEFRITDKNLPVSPAFIDFLHQYVFDEIRTTSWHDQISEELTNETQQVLNNASANLQKVISHPTAQHTINKSYNYLLSLLFGSIENLQSLHADNTFILIVGAPRSGGSYLTKHLFQSLGYTIENTPAVIAHDGFPDPVPFSIENNNNAHTTLTRHTAEFIAMAELFFSNDKRTNDKNGRNTFIIPKKMTKAAYYGAFFNQALGPNTEIILTIRHPTAACISTIEKSGGLPDKGHFKIRSHIESWISRDIEYLTGNKPGLSDDYFDCYLQYWENYHYSLVTSGLLANSNVTILPYTSDHLYSEAQKFYHRFNTSHEIDEFITYKKIPPSSEWISKGDKAITRISNMWESFGHKFPTNEILNNF